MAMKKVTVALSDDMEAALENLRKKKMLDSVPETIRFVLSEYLSEKESEQK